MNKINLNQIDWVKIQKIHDDGIFWCDLHKHCELSKTVLIRANKEGMLIKRIHVRKTSDEVKKKISNSRKKFLKENPDKHPWKNSNKFKSVPCEILKNKLIEKQINFISEYEPSNDRFYAIDIAFPNKKIGVEINGNQHYNNNGELKEYYVERNKYLNSIGWIIYDIHYSIVYNEMLLNELIIKIEKHSLSQDELNMYLLEIIDKTKNRKGKKIIKLCIDCKCDIYKNAVRCKKCQAIFRRKTLRPDKNELINLINEIKNWRKISKIFGVTDVTVRKWAKTYNII